MIFVNLTKKLDSDKVENETIILDKTKVHILNETGSAIWNKLMSDGKIPLNDLIEMNLDNDDEVDISIKINDILLFINNLFNENLIFFNII